MISQGGLNVGPLYSLMNEIRTFFMITKMNKDIIIKLAEHMYHHHGIVTILV